MKLTYGELLNSSDAMSSGEPGPLTRLRRASLPFQTASRIREVVRVFNEKFKDLIEQREELFERYAAKSDDGTQWLFGKDQDRIDAFNKEYNDLMLTVIEIPGTRLTTRQMLSTTAISATDLDVLEWLIDDGVMQRVDPVDPTQAAIEEAQQDETVQYADEVPEDDEDSGELLEIAILAKAAEA